MEQHNEHLEGRARVTSSLRCASSKHQQQHNYSFAREHRHLLIHMVFAALEDLFVFIGARARSITAFNMQATNAITHARIHIPHTHRLLPHIHIANKFQYPLNTHTHTQHNTHTTHTHTYTQRELGERERVCVYACMCVWC